MSNERHKWRTYIFIYPAQSFHWTAISKYTQYLKKAPAWLLHMTVANPANAFVKEIFMNEWTNQWDTTPTPFLVNMKDKTDKIHGAQIVARQNEIILVAAISSKGRKAVSSHKALARLRVWWWPRWSSILSILRPRLEPPLNWAYKPSRPGRRTAVYFTKANTVTFWSATKF